MTEEERDARNDAQLTLALSKQLIEALHNLPNVRFERVLAGVIAGVTCFECGFKTRDAANWVDSSLVPHVLKIIAQIEAERNKSNGPHHNSENDAG